MTKTPEQISTDSIEWSLSDKLAFIFYNAAGETMNQTLYKASRVIAEVHRQIEAEARAATVEQIVADANLLLSERQRFAIRALAALPPTHQVVPVEPTEAMINAAFDATVWPDLNRATTSDVIKSLRLNMAKEYKAMLAASKGEA